MTCDRLDRFIPACSIGAIDGSQVMVVDDCLIGVVTNTSGRVNNKGAAEAVESSLGQSLVEITRSYVYGKSMITIVHPC